MLIFRMLKFGLLAASIFYLSVAFYSFVFKKRKEKLRFTEFALFCRDYIVICLNPNASIVYLENIHRQERFRIFVGKIRDARITPQRLIAMASTRVQSLWNDLLVGVGIRRRPLHILVIGQSGSGKSSLIGALQGKAFLDHRVPTLHVEKYEIMVRVDSPTVTTATTKELVLIDNSGQTPSRRLLPDYFRWAQGVIFMVDSGSVRDVQEFKNEINRLISDENLRGKPFLVLGNKMDLSSVVEGQEIWSNLVLDNIDGSCPVKFCVCSMKKNVGYAVGMNWLCHTISTLQAGN